MRIRFTEHAITDLETINAYLEEKSPAGARSMRIAVDSKIEQIGEFPLAARESDIRGVFELSVVRYPYNIYYEIVDDEIWIIHVRDARREPWDVTESLPWEARRVDPTMTEVLFYHLDRQPLERVLPELLEKCLERGWRTVVQLGSEERCEAIDAHLWTYRDDGFLPHGTAKDGHAEAQPVWLTTRDDNPNGATVRFVADGADLPDAAGYARIVMLFDGNDNDAVDRARAAWTTAKSAGHEATYWQQSEHGRWERKA